MTTPETQVDTRPWTPEITFGARLALIRHRMGWNIKEAAAACGLPAQSWRGWEIHGREPHRLVTVAMAIATRTGCDLNWLLGTDRVRSCAYVGTRVLTRAWPTSDGHLATTRPVRQTRPIVTAAPRPRSRVAT